MKQKKYGQKIQNWHRPLRQFEPRQRFLAQRHADPGLIMHGNVVVDKKDELNDSFYYHSYWYHEGTNPDLYEDSSHWCLGSDFDYLNSLSLEQIKGHVQVSSVIRWNIDQDIELIDDTQDELSTSPQNLIGGIEARLVEYYDALTSVLTKSPYIFKKISESTDPSEIALIQNIDSAKVKHLSHSNKYRWAWQLSSIKHFLVLFSPFWIRSPLDWDGDSIESLFQHLFVLYDIPKHLEWLVLYSEQVDSCFDGMKWYFAAIHLAQGGSMKQFAKSFDLHLAPKFNYFYNQVPSEIRLEEAIIYAEILRLGGTDIDFRRITSDPSYVVDISKAKYYYYSEIGWDMKIYRDFWYGAVNWLIKNRDEITQGDSADVLAWAMHKFTETLRARIPLPWEVHEVTAVEQDNRDTFSWKGRGRTATLNRARAYSEELLNRRAGKFFAWHAKGWDCTITDNETIWEIREILNSRDLFKEGQAMNHCVVLQAENCAANQAAIFSLSIDDMRTVTIHVSPITGQLIEAKQRFNVLPTLEQTTIINRWLRTVVLGQAKNNSSA